MPLVRLSHQPEGADPVFVPDDELTALQAQGLLVAVEESPKPAPPKPAQPAQPAPVKPTEN